MESDKFPMPRPLLMIMVLREQLLGTEALSVVGLHKAGQWKGKPHLVCLLG